jgi:hypothetical protein
VMKQGWTRRRVSAAFGVCETHSLPAPEAIQLFRLVWDSPRPRADPRPTQAAHGSGVHRAEVAMRKCLSLVSFLSIAGLCLFFIGMNAETCSANMLPESGMLLHVQPVSGSCETEIRYCRQVVPWTTETGLLEFLIFFQPIYWQHFGGEPAIRQADVTVRWPQSWELVRLLR